MSANNDIEIVDDFDLGDDYEKDLGVLTTTKAEPSAEKQEWNEILEAEEPAWEVEEYPGVSKPRMFLLTAVIAISIIAAPRSLLGVDLSFLLIFTYAAGAYLSWLYLDNAKKFPSARHNLAGARRYQWKKQRNKGITRDQLEVTKGHVLFLQSVTLGCAAAFVYQLFKIMGIA